tara:strand:+ start:786 stop:1220 length:435 start_codon:yes stop_codon:yes gene_type:complete
MSSNHFSYNDGGRSDAGFKGTTGDCVVRAITIATGFTYSEIYSAMNLFVKDERLTKRKRNKSASRTGVHKDQIQKFLNALNWTWTPTMFIGQGCKVHLKADELPSGVLIVSLSKHVTCVIDGVINDTYDCSRNGTRCVYGYWTK